MVCVQSFDLPVEEVEDASTVEEHSSSSRVSGGFGKHEAVETQIKQSAHAASVVGGSEAESGSPKAHPRQLRRKRNSAKTVQNNSNSLPVWDELTIWRPEGETVQTASPVYTLYESVPQQTQSVYTLSQDKSYYYPVDYVDVSPQQMMFVSNGQTLSQSQVSTPVQVVYPLAQTVQEQTSPRVVNLKTVEYGSPYTVSYLRSPVQSYSSPIQVSGVSSSVLSSPQLQRTVQVVPGVAITTGASSLKSAAKVVEATSSKSSSPIYSEYAYDTPSSKSSVFPETFATVKVVSSSSTTTNPPPVAASEVQVPSLKVTVSDKASPVVIFSSGGKANATAVATASSSADSLNNTPFNPNPGLNGDTNGNALPPPLEQQSTPALSVKSHASASASAAASSASSKAAAFAASSSSVSNLNSLNPNGADASGSAASKASAVTFTPQSYSVSVSSLAWDTNNSQSPPSPSPSNAGAAAAASSKSLGKSGEIVQQQALLRGPTAGGSLNSKVSSGASSFADSNFTSGAGALPYMVANESASNPLNQTSPPSAFPLSAASDVPGKGSSFRASSGAASSSSGSSLQASSFSSTFVSRCEELAACARKRLKASRLHRGFTSFYFHPLSSGDGLALCRRTPEDAAASALSKGLASSSALDGLGKFWSANSFAAKAPSLPSDATAQTSAAACSAGVGNGASKEKCSARTTGAAASAPWPSGVPESLEFPPSAAPSLPSSRRGFAGAGSDGAGSGQWGSWRNAPQSRGGSMPTRDQLLLWSLFERLERHAEKIANLEDLSLQQQRTANGGAAGDAWLSPGAAGRGERLGLLAGGPPSQWRSSPAAGVRLPLTESPGSALSASKNPLWHLATNNAASRLVPSSAKEQRLDPETLREVMGRAEYPGAASAADGVWPKGKTPAVGFAPPTSPSLGMEEESDGQTDADLYWQWLMTANDPL